jgi:adenylate kinase family enzyme
VDDIPALSQLGRRICIMGPSNAGKSTLAEALSTKLGVPPIFLDQLHHLPHTNWQPRPAQDFHDLQLAALEGSEWIMDGNYSAMLPERLARATGAIVLDDGRWARLARYCYRTLLQGYRPGNLEGNRDSIKWTMIQWILVGSRYNGPRYRQFVTNAGLPHVFCSSMAEVKALYRQWDLRPPRPL